MKFAEYDTMMAMTTTKLSANELQGDTGPAETVHATGACLACNNNRTSHTPVSTYDLKWGTILEQQPSAAHRYLLSCLLGCAGTCTCTNTYRAKDVADHPTERGREHAARDADDARQALGASADRETGGKASTQEKVIKWQATIRTSHERTARQGHEKHVEDTAETRADRKEKGRRQLAKRYSRSRDPT